MDYRTLLCSLLLAIGIATPNIGGRVRRTPVQSKSNGICWSPWFSDDSTSPRTDLEIETIFVVRNIFPNETCDVPIDIQCRTVATHIPYNETFENVLCIVEYGLQCRQVRNELCSDYEIRIACPCNISNSVTYETSSLENQQTSTLDSVTFYLSSTSEFNSARTDKYSTEKTLTEEITTVTSKDRYDHQSSRVTESIEASSIDLLPVNQSPKLRAVTEQPTLVVSDEMTKSTPYTATSQILKMTYISKFTPEEPSVKITGQMSSGEDPTVIQTTPIDLGVFMETTYQPNLSMSDTFRTVQVGQHTVSGTVPDVISTEYTSSYESRVDGKTTSALPLTGNNFSGIPMTSKILPSSSTSNSFKTNSEIGLSAMLSISTVSQQTEITEEVTQTFELMPTQPLEILTVTQTINFSQIGETQSCGTISCYNSGICFKPKKENRKLKCNCTNGWEGRQCQKDRQPPEIQCPSNIKRVINTMTDSRYVSWDRPIVTDNDVYHNSTIKSNVSFGTFSVGKVIVEYIAEDFAGNVAKPCTFKILLFVGCKYSKASNLTWRRVELNNYRSSQEKCPEGTPRVGMPKGTRYCGTDNDGNAKWMPPSIQNCLQSIMTTYKTNEQTEEELVNLSQITVTMENVIDVAKELTTLITGVDEVSEEMFNAIAVTLDNIVNVGSTSIEVTEVVFSAVNNLLSADIDVVNTAKSSTKIIKAVDTQVNLAQEGQGSFQFKEANVAVMANTNNESVVKGGLGFASIQKEGEGGLENTQWNNFLKADEVPVIGVDVSCQIPEEIRKYVGSRDLQMSYVIYANGMLFSSSLTSEVNSSVEIMSRVMSVSAKGTEVTNLQDPIAIFFGIPPTKSNFKSAKCVYWDFTLQNGIGDWSTDGCFMNDTNNNEALTCYCNHLTHFAVLLEFERKSMEEDVRLALVLISKVGCLVSIGSLIVTLVAFLSFRRLRCERPQRILISLSVSLLCLYMMFMIGIEPGDHGNEQQKNKCMVSAVILHYFTLTSIFWMVVEAINLYYNLIKVFKSKVSLFMLKASIFAWGMPGLIVGGVAGWQTTRKEYKNDKYCFMQIGYPFYLSLALPVALCLLFNIIVFMRIMCELMCRRTRSSNSKKSMWKNLSKRAQNAFGISVLLGLTWIFGFLTFDIKHDYIFDVFFCVFNSLQGVFVFVFFCVRQKEVRITWKRFICGQKQASYHVASSSGNSTRYINRSERPTSANIDLFGKNHNELINNRTKARFMYDYNNATNC